MKKNCEICKKEFETKRKNKTCSKECRKKLMCLKQKEIQNRPERKLISFNTATEYSNRPEVKEKFSKFSKELQNREDIKKKKSIFMKEYQNRPEVKEKKSKDVTLYQNLPEIKKKNSEQAKYHQNLPEIKEKNRERQKNRMLNDVKYKNKVKKILNEYVKGDKFKKDHSETMLKLWQTESYVENKKNGFFKMKDYILPSGKIVKIQGYENLYLDEYFREGNLESDILIENKDIKREIGIIKYIEDDKEHRYFPDFYIRSSKTIVEIKSIWTYNNNVKKTISKELACLTLGYNFKLKIY